MRFFLCLFYMFHRRYSNCRPLNSARYNRIICQTVENTSFFGRMSCILHALAKGYQGYKSNFGFRVPFDREIWQIWDQKSVFGFAERNTPLVIDLKIDCNRGFWRHLGWGANTAKITVNVWDFGPLGTAINAATKRQISNICPYFKQFLLISFIHWKMRLLKKVRRP